MIYYLCTLVFKNVDYRIFLFLFFFSLPNFALFIFSVGAHEPWVMGSRFLSSAWRVLKRLSLPTALKKGRR